MLTNVQSDAATSPGYRRRLAVTSNGVISTTATVPVLPGSLLPETLGPGTFVGEYEIAGTIAAGGGGTVYRARHRTLGRVAAVKVLHPYLVGSPVMEERFVREARALALLRHPNVVDVFDFGQLPDGRPFYAMELLEGETLQCCLRQRGRLSAAEALELIEPICDALEATHSRGIIHRDLKASNVAFATSRDGARIVKLLDFGVAKFLGACGNSSETLADVRVGTPCAMAPEQIQGGPIDARTDVYALGVMLYQLVTGELPFEGADPSETERLHLEALPPRPSSRAPVSPAVEDVILRALEKNPAARQQSAAELSSELRAAVCRSDSDSTVAVCAIALYVEAHLCDDAPDGDEALLQELAAAMDFVDAAARDAGLSPAVSAGSSLIAARPLPAAPEVQLEVRRAVVSVAVDLADALSRCDPRLRFWIGIACDRAILRSRRIVAGPLLRLSTWSSSALVSGPCARLEVLDALREWAAPLPIGSGPSRFVPIRRP